MPLLQILILASIQGITEFIPISSSGHLILLPEFFDWDDQGLLVDVAVHMGTLFAVIIYFWRDIFKILTSVYYKTLLRRKSIKTDENYKLLLNLVIATLPIIPAGYLINYYSGDILRSMEVIGWATIVFAILLLLADKVCMTFRKLGHISYFGALWIGLFQIIALIPGTSRAGITITAARLLGVERQDAAKFSMLLSIPVITAAGTLKLVDAYTIGDPSLIMELIEIASLTFIIALATIFIFLRWLKNSSFTPFVIYRLILGGIIILFAYQPFI